MKMKSVLSIILVLCLMASFIFCAPAQATAAEANLENSQGNTEGAPAGGETEAAPEDGETEAAPEGGETETTPEGGETETTPEGDGEKSFWEKLLDTLLGWGDTGAPWQVRGFLMGFDNLCEASIDFGMKAKTFAGNTYSLIRYLIDLFT